MSCCAVPGNIHTPPMEGFWFCTPPPLPTGNSSLASYFASKVLTFKTPLPLGISDKFPRGGYVFFFVELHILQCWNLVIKFWKFMVLLLDTFTGRWTFGIKWVPLCCFTALVSLCNQTKLVGEIKKASRIYGSRKRTVARVLRFGSQHWLQN